jgi:hypothetical protein
MQISAMPVRSRQNAQRVKAVGIYFVPFFKRSWIELKPISKQKLIRRPCGKEVFGSNLYSGRPSNFTD